MMSRYFFLFAVFATLLYLFRTSHCDFLRSVFPCATTKATISQRSDVKFNYLKVEESPCVIQCFMDQWN